MSKQRRLHEPSSLMWSHQWKVQGGERGGQGVGLVASEVKKETENIVATFACVPMTWLPNPCWPIAKTFCTGCPQKVLLNLSEKSHADHFDFCQTFNSSSFEIPQIFLFSITLLPSSPFSVICRINSETGLRAKTWFYFPSVCLGGEGWVQRWWRPWLQRPPWLQSLRVQAATQAGL